ncbi:hypothetical protein Ppa06_63380 [Planomonospora parontospora subsp. parontospora]|uniref:Uncharacterized protein n=2 Tax=Planomonospora parontospora TaxID=58119 RepID=A0AA37F820_9ACTN|nr:hypothetical protein [Planomonospora parontospora]GGK97548.1 hypothetical protein GCM10010126_66230 [Planomonospora parontospora]GII12540.1 hypothetical protein Ppa06_63380 [Planomonospora parontospora subsp. parontospora]
MIYDMIGMLYQVPPLTVGGLVFVALYLILRRTRPGSGYLLLTASAWFLAALDEWYITTYQPYMNIRIDALAFLAFMAITTPLGILMAVFGKRIMR